MAYTTINKSTDYFNTKLYTGNNGTQSITGVGHQPDLIWVKARNDTANHTLTDAVRGTNSVLYSNQNQGIDAPTNAITSFDSDGFSVGNNGSFNANSTNYASWNWKANGAGSANTTGSINTTATSVNTTAGFSICKWTGNGSAGATVGHGLGSAPKVVITKRYDGGTNNWVVGHGAIGFTKVIYLNTTAGSASDSGSWNNTAPSSTVFTVGSNNESNGNGYEFISYCFAEKTGYSKFGSYTGTSSEVFIHTGFKPKFILIKKTSEAASWHLFDTSRTVSNGGNQLNKILFPNLNNAEADDAYNYVDAYSNGFRCFSGPSGQGTETNKNDQTFIFMAFGQSIVGSNNIPATAR